VLRPDRLSRIAAMAEAPITVIVGLGNPGPRHALDRHNAGFWFVDRLAARSGEVFRAQARYQGDTAKIRLADAEIVLLKPQTYMNRSGLAVRTLLDYLKIAPAQLLVVHDELDLPVGVARFKLGGGAGGHNGLRDTIAHIGAEFWRLRLGIGHPGDRSQVTDYVLQRAPREEEAAIQDAITAAIDAIATFVAEGPERAMNQLHSRREEGGVSS
jgi:peptidyl-tRNA hydrolase, PTH1 family